MGFNIGKALKSAVMPAVTAHAAAFNAFAPRRSGGNAAGGSSATTPIDPRLIQDQYQRVLGRTAREEELGFFKSMIEGGYLSPYELGQFLESEPEMQQTRLTQQTENYAQMLGKYDDQILGRAQDMARSDVARRGLAGSSSYGAMFSNAARDLAMNRQSMLAQFYNQGVGNLNASYLNRGNTAMSRAYGLTDETRRRGWDISDYYREKDDFNSYLRQQNRWNRENAALGAAFKLPGQLVGGLGASKLGV